MYLEKLPKMFLEVILTKNSKSSPTVVRKLGQNQKGLTENKQIISKTCCIFFYFHHIIVMIEINLITKIEIELVLLRQQLWCLNQKFSIVGLQHPLDVIGLNLFTQHLYCSGLLTKDVINCFRKQKYMKYNAIVNNKTDK